MYRLGLFSALCELLAFRYIAPSKDDKGPPNEDAAVSDAAKVLALALNKYILSQKVMTDEYSPERFLQALKEVITFGGTAITATVGHNLLTIIASTTIIITTFIVVVTSVITNSTTVKILLLCHRQRCCSQYYYFPLLLHLL